MDCLHFFCHIGLVRSLLRKRFGVNLPALAVEQYGLHFKNPVGLGAGFDKNARYLRELECLGFGFIEIGTVTPLGQPGNDQPRLFRLKKDKALINRMGFNNEGVEKVAERLKLWRAKNSSLIIGGNIGKNKRTPNEEAWKDYEICFKELHPYVDYFVVNISSPNTPGLRELQEKEALRKILVHLQMINNGKARSKPILLKIAPDLTEEQLDGIIDLVLEIKLDGLVCSNTTISRENLSTEKEHVQAIGAGGLSGWPLREKAQDILEYVYQQSHGSIPVIASGGIFSAADAHARMDAGASLVQVWTAFIYEGPGIAQTICKRLNSDY